MIEIHKSTNADTRTCDVSQVTQTELLAASRQHIGDVAQAMAFFANKLFLAAAEHDYDKLTEIEWFYADFQTKFEKTGWWDNHRKIHRHHLDYADGVPADVNLLDILEYVADGVMAGIARSGEVRPSNISDELLRTAFTNTEALLAAQVRVVEDVTNGESQGQANKSDLRAGIPPAPDPATQPPNELLIKESAARRTNKTTICWDYEAYAECLRLQELTGADRETLLRTAFTLLRIYVNTLEDGTTLEVRGHARTNSWIHFPDVQLRK